MRNTAHRKVRDISTQLQMKLYSTHGTFHPIAPFDYDKSLDFISEFTPMSGEQTLAPRSLTKTLSLNGSAIVFQINLTGTVEQPALDYTLYSAHKLDAATEQLALERIRFFLSLDEDLKPFYALAESDEKFAPVVKRLYGLHHVKFLTPFENAAWAILTQRQPIRVAHLVKTALIQKYGSCLDVNGQEFCAFPEPVQLALLTAEALNEIVRNDRKTTYLRAVIDAFLQVDDSFLYHAPTKELRTWLLNIKGIGDWSADFILLRGLGRMEGMRMSEYSIRGDPFGKAIAKVYNDGKPLSNPERERLGTHYQDWQGYWAYYLRVNA